MERDKIMAKIKTIHEIDMRANGGVFYIPKDEYIEVTESMAVYFCDEDIEAMSVAEQKRHRRTKKAIRTPQDEQSNTHIDYTSIN